MTLAKLPARSKCPYLYGHNYFTFACLASRLNKVYSHSSSNLATSGETGSNGANPTKKPQRYIFCITLSSFTPTVVLFLELAFSQFGYIFLFLKTSQKPQFPTDYHGIWDLSF